MIGYILRDKLENGVEGIGCGVTLETIPEICLEIQRNIGIT
jgi:hypothetical protein